MQDRRKAAVGLMYYKCVVVYAADVDGALDEFVNFGTNWMMCRSCGQ